MRFFHQARKNNNLPQLEHCQACGKAVFRAQVIAATRKYYSQTGKIADELDLQKKYGYRCVKCGQLICQGCMEKKKHAVGHTDWLCPVCGGNLLSME